MGDEKNRIRCNMYLDRESVETVKEFMKDTGLNLSSYVDLLICGAAERIQTYWTTEEIPRINKDINGHKYVDILKAHKILGVFDMHNSDLFTKQQWKKVKKGDLKILFDGKPYDPKSINEDSE